MKKFTIFTSTAFLFLSVLITPANAQIPGMMNGLQSNDIKWNEVLEHTKKEEQEGKELREKLQAKQINCSELKDDDFDVLGEYFMGQMMGDSHTAMNAMMMQMRGEKGEGQIHIVMGKRLSGCDAQAAFAEGEIGFMPMMNMMMGGWSVNGAEDRSSPFGFNSTNNMMNFGFSPFGGFGWIFMILWWILIIAGIIALIKWLMGESRGGNDIKKSALEILETRYAKGEIDKKEFEEKKSDLRK